MDNYVERLNTLEHAVVTQRDVIHGLLVHAERMTQQLDLVQAEHVKQIKTMTEEIQSLQNMLTNLLQVKALVD